jgi:hypothetical protein
MPEFNNSPYGCRYHIYCNDAYVGSTDNDQDAIAYGGFTPFVVLNNEGVRLFVANIAEQADAA